MSRKISTRYAQYTLYITLLLLRLGHNQARKKTYIYI